MLTITTTTDNPKSITATSTDEGPVCHCGNQLSDPLDIVAVTQIRPDTWAAVNLSGNDPVCDCLVEPVDYDDQRDMCSLCGSIYRHLGDDESAGSVIEPVAIAVNSEDVQRARTAYVSALA